MACIYIYYITVERIYQYTSYYYSRYINIPKEIETSRMHILQPDLSGSPTAAERLPPDH